ncbi:MAG TPA: amidohydrolase, partial [Candidatus Limnocylindria bacterium]|nr:amidohydrolase [Candidatus Limnocylindria bacterium]
VICGQVIVAADSSGLETAEAVGIRDARVVSVGSRRDVTDAAATGARVLDFGAAAVVPGLHDFHLHLVGLARSSRALRLDDARDAGEVAERVASAAASLDASTWLTGRGWTAAQLSDAPPGLLEDAVGGARAFLTSHDGHSAWASAAAMRLAGVGSATPDPAGGRLERDENGEPTGVLRETALDLVAPRVPRLQGASLREPMDETLRELASLGITGASEAGDYTDENGLGADAVLGDSYSSLTDLSDLVDGRLRLTLGIPADALPAATARGLRTGQPLAGRRTMRFGWAKEYADGSLGSGTAALFAPRTCADRDAGILRVSADELDALFAAGRRGRIGMAVHAIGDRAASAVLDAVARAGPPPSGVPGDRMEHAQLVRAEDHARFAELGVTASIQPIHAAADRDMVEDCWGGRQADAFAWMSLASAGAHLAAGSDAPVEDANPWLGLFAAVHRRLPGDRREDWRVGEALDIGRALAAYTRGPALAVGASDEGHLRPGARADLAVLTCDLATLQRADDALAAIRSQLTLVDGVEVHSA